MNQTMTAPKLRDSVSLAELFEARERRPSLDRLPSPFGTSESRRTTALAPLLQSTLIAPKPVKNALAHLPKLSTPRTVTLEEIEGVLTNFGQSLDSERLGTITLTLPFGLDHYLVNAATFKALAGREEDTLLRREGRRWRIVENDEQIDLGDRTQVFKLGRVEIYS